jgi:hypothetical protein
MRGELLLWRSIEIARLYNWKMKNSKPNFIISGYSNNSPINDRWDHPAALVPSWTLHSIYYPTARLNCFYLLLYRIFWSLFRAAGVFS